MSINDTLPITRIPRTGLPPRALVVGDPARAADIAALLHEGRRVAANREYHTYTGSWKGSEVVVSSHGVGGPGALCLFEELTAAGVRDFIRLGTAGALRSDIVDGDLVIADAAVRDDGVTQQVVPPEYPAFADAEAVIALRDAAAAQQAPHHRGVVWTRAAFSPGVVQLPTTSYIAAGVVAIEMELSALLVHAGRGGLRAAGVLVVDGNAADDHPDPTTYDPHRDVVRAGVQRGIEVALNALVALS